MRTTSPNPGTKPDLSHYHSTKCDAKKVANSETCMATSLNTDDWMTKITEKNI